jgi:hypothetical protein
MDGHMLNWMVIGFIFLEIFQICPMICYFILFLFLFFDRINEHRNLICMWVVIIWYCRAFIGWDVHNHDRREFFILFWGNRLFCYFGFLGRCGGCWWLVFIGMWLFGGGFGLLMRVCPFSWWWGWIVFRIIVILVFLRLCDNLYHYNIGSHLRIFLVVIRVWLVITFK